MVSVQLSYNYLDGLIWGFSWESPKFYWFLVYFMGDHTKWILVLSRNKPTWWTGTTSMWELSMIEGSAGSSPSQVMMTTGFPVPISCTCMGKLSSAAWLLRKVTQSSKTPKAVSRQSTWNLYGWTTSVLDRLGRGVKFIVVCVSKTIILRLAKVSSRYEHTICSHK
jgi:hypothetical protein